MAILIVSMLVCVLLIAAALVIIKVKQPKKQKGELLRLAETSVTAVMGLMTIALAFFILYMKYADSTLGGSDLTSYLFVAGFAIICAAVGSGILLYTFLAKVIAYEDRMVSVDLLGQTRDLYWNEITEVKVSRFSNKAVLVGKGGQVVVGGEPKTYKKFVNIAKKKIKHAVSGDVLDKILNRFMF